MAKIVEVSESIFFHVGNYPTAQKSPASQLSAMSFDAKLENDLSMESRSDKVSTIADQPLPGQVLKGVIPKTSLYDDENVWNTTSGLDGPEMLWILDKNETLVKGLRFSTSESTDSVGSSMENVDDIVTVTKMDGETVSKDVRSMSVKTTSLSITPILSPLSNELEYQSTKSLGPEEEFTKSSVTVYTSDASSTYVSDIHERLLDDGISMSRPLELCHIGVIALQRISSLLDDDGNSYNIFPLTLDNVDYHSTFDQASTHADLSTIDGPISTDIASAAFFLNSNPPKEIPIDLQSEISSLNNHGGEKAQQEDPEVGIPNPTRTASLTAVTITDSFFDFVHSKTPIELFFLSLIFLSTIAFFVLMSIAFSLL